MIDEQDQTVGSEVSNYVLSVAGYKRVMAGMADRNRGIIRLNMNSVVCYN